MKLGADEQQSSFTLASHFLLLTSLTIHWLDTHR